MLNRLNLIWRILGGNFLLMFISFLSIKCNMPNANYIFVTNLNLVIIALLHITRKKLSMTSDTDDILNLYVICLCVVNFCYIENVYQCLMSIISALFNSIWIIKFFMLEKSRIVSK